MNLVYSAAKYCVPVRQASRHTSAVDTPISRAMRIISGTIESIDTERLPVLCNMQPPDLRRKEAILTEYRKIVANTDFPIHKYYIHRAGLQSRCSFWIRGEHLSNSQVSMYLPWMVQRLSPNQRSNCYLLLYGISSSTYAFDNRHRQFVVLES